MVRPVTAGPLIVDLFAGPGGWDCGLAYLGHRNVVGLEWDKAACATRAAAGHHTIRTDIAAYPTLPFARRRVDGLIASPPCQAFSLAGPGEATDEMHDLLTALYRVSQGDDTAIEQYAAKSADPRAALVLEPIRWVRDLRPRWVALEQVVLVLPLWEATRHILLSWGYSVWTGILNAADFGVGQARRRAVLVARNDGTAAAPPEPTHAEDPQPTLFGTMMQPWVTLAGALGWTETDAKDAAIAATGKPDGHKWVFERPSTTLVASFRPDIISPPGYRSAGDGPRQKQRGSVTVTVEEAARLQSFPASYPWQGSDAKQRQQIGNAVPPMLAAHVLAPLVGGEVPQEIPTWRMAEHRRTLAQPRQLGELAGVA